MDKISDLKSIILNTLDSNKAIDIISIDLENKSSTSIEWMRHSEFEDIKKIRRYRPNNGEGGMETVYKVTKIKTKQNPAL